MKKIILLDIGTHKCQEFKAVFHTNPLLLFARVLSHKIMRLKSPSFKTVFSIIKSQKILKKNRKSFFVILTEPNTNVFSHPLYKKADQVYCIAVGKNNEKIKLSNLYFHAKNLNLEEQGPSIFQEKSGIKSNFAIPITKISPEYYLNFIKHNFEEKFPNCEYELILRMNCEGSEYELIKNAKDIFGNRFNLVLGSLDDVLKYHGKFVYREMLDYLDKENIEFNDFTTLLTSHDCALKKLVAHM